MQHVEVIEVARAPSETREIERRLPVVTFEQIAYVALLALALVLRLAELDTIPFRENEANRALAAWTILRPEAFGDVDSTTSPLLLLLQTTSFSVLGGTEFAARILTALAGTAVVFTPLLFRSVLGRGRTFLMSVALGFSPVLLMASREASPVVWTLLLLVLGGWAALRYWQDERQGYALLASALVAAAILVTEPGGWILAAVTGAALWIGTSLLRQDTLDDSNGFADDERRELRAILRGWPSTYSLGVAALAVLLIATGFMLNPRGVSNIGALLGAGLTGLVMAEPGAPPLHALFVSLFYEPFLWGFGLAGLLLAWQRGMSAVDRVFAVWLALGVVGLILFAGAQPAHALWVVAPLAGLASRVILIALEDDPRRIWTFPWWSRWLIATITVALLAVFAIALQAVGRSLTRLDLSAGVELRLIDPIGGIITVMMLLFFVVGFFLASNIWDRGTAARGAALGLLIFGLCTSLGSGWNAAVPRYDNAEELWRLRTTTVSAPMLRDTLYDIAQRETRGEPAYRIAVQAPGDGVIAWLLRDFTAVQPIDGPTQAEGFGVILLPGTTGDTAEPDLPGNYLGQSFILSREWSLSQLRVQDWLAWWLEREAPLRPIPAQVYHLWLREDVYIGNASE